MYCVIEINLTQKTASIACTGLYGVEAKVIADSRNMDMCLNRPTYQLPGFCHKPDKKFYIISHKNLVEDAIRYFWENYQD